MRIMSLKRLAVNNALVYRRSLTTKTPLTLGKILLVCGLLFLSTGVYAEVAIVVHPTTSVTSTTHDEITKIFLGKTTAFSDGSKITPVDQSEGSGTRDEFYSKVANKTASQLNAYWSRLIFTGKGQPPKALEDDDEVIETVAESPGVVGYVSIDAVTDDVKVLLTVP